MEQYVIPEKVQEAKVFLVDYPETRARFEKVKNLIQGYETPYGLELLATVYWVMVKEREEGSVANPNYWFDQSALLAIIK